MAIKVEKKHVGFKMPKSKHDILMRLVEENGGGRGVITDIMNDAFNEYLERRATPEPEKERIRQVLRRNPMLLDEGVVAQIREIVQEEFRTLSQQRPHG